MKGVQWFIILITDGQIPTIFSLNFWSSNYLTCWEIYFHSVQKVWTPFYGHPPFYLFLKLSTFADIFLTIWSQWNTGKTQVSKDSEENKHFKWKALLSKEHYCCKIHTLSTHANPHITPFSIYKLPIWTILHFYKKMLIPLSMTFQNSQKGGKVNTMIQLKGSTLGDTFHRIMPIPTLIYKLKT